MSLLWLLLLVILLANFGGGQYVSTWSASPLYYPSYGIIILVFLIVWLSGVR